MTTDEITERFSYIQDELFQTASSFSHRFHESDINDTIYEAICEDLRLLDPELNKLVAPQIVIDIKKYTIELSLVRIH
jgi:hypothetical protein